MSKALGVEQILAHAREREREYDWLGAFESYKKTLDLLPEQDFSRKGDVCERSGYSLYRAAMQSESVDEFKAKINHAIGNYEAAGEFYGKLSGPGSTARTLRCRAMISYLGFWLTSEVPEKKRLVDESWRLTKDALKAFSKAEDASEYGRTYNQLSTCPGFGFNLEWKPEARERTVREAFEHGEQAIKLLSNLGDPYELARVYVNTAHYLNHLSFYTQDLVVRERNYNRILDYWLKAKSVSEETALLELANSALGFTTVIGEGTDEALMTCEKALESGKRTKDRFVIGSALDILAYHTWWKFGLTEDPDEGRKLLLGALKYAEDAKQQFDRIALISPRGGSMWIENAAEYYWILGVHVETDLQQRRFLFEKAVQVAPEGIKLAEESGYPEVLGTAHHVFSKSLAALASTEPKPEQKAVLLESALEHRKESISLTEHLEPFAYFNHGVMQNYLAEIKSELAELATDPESKRNLLQEAVMDKETCLRLCNKEMPFYERTGSFSNFYVVGRWQHEYGTLLIRLYELTRNTKDLSGAAKAFEEAAESFQKPNLRSRMAESYWEAAQVYDTLEDHLKAAEKFLLASDNYREASKRIPQLKEFYQDHTIYMEAWSEIEKARYRHARQEYGPAKEFYEKAAVFHKSTKEWSFLAPNYSALAQVENAEDLSRKEQSQDAIQAFQNAARLFSETKVNLQGELSSIENPDKKEMVTSLTRGADLRREYCMSRIVLEEAKDLNRKGDHYSSSEKYGQAAESFDRIARGLESEQGQRELKHIATLSKAWHMMTRAEEEASPGLYLEASRLFEEAKELSQNEKARSLALGHSRFCRALEAGTRFADTGDPLLHAAAIQHMQSASKHYLQAGFQDASEYADGTELLFDAYLHMDEAKREKDHEKKAKLYTMTEKLLQASSDSFLKAQHPAKREQVLRLLDRVKRERELALSLTEVLRTPSFVSATIAFSAPTPTRERAVGLERFDHADVQASLITRHRQLKVGEDLDLEIELVNAGKGPAQLVKVEELIPEGFELKEKPETYRVEDSYLSMKGKRLDPLKTEEIRLVLRPNVQGQFTLKPRILYLDESGKYKSHEPEPIEVTVKELGISGWLKGR